MNNAIYLMQVLINGKIAGFFERSNPRNLPLPNVFGIGPNEEVSPGLALSLAWLPISDPSRPTAVILYLHTTVDSLLLHTQSNLSQKVSLYPLSVMQALCLCGHQN